MEMTSACVFCEWNSGRQEQQAPVFSRKTGAGWGTDCLAVALSGRETPWNYLAAHPSSSPGSAHFTFSESQSEINSQCRAIHSRECRRCLTASPIKLLLAQAAECCHHCPGGLSMAGRWSREDWSGMPQISTADPAQALTCWVNMCWSLLPPHLCLHFHIFLTLREQGLWGFICKLQE